MDQTTFTGRSVTKAAVIMALVAIVALLFFLLLLLAEKTMYDEYRTLFFEISEVGRTIMLIFSAVMAAFLGFLSFWTLRFAIVSVTLSPETLIVTRAANTTEIRLTDVRNLVSVTNRTRIEGIKVAESESIRIILDRRFIEINERQLNGFSRFEVMLKKYVQLGPQAAGETPAVWVCATCAQSNPASVWSCRGCGTDR